MAKLIVALRILANAPKNSEYACQLLSISESLDFTSVYILYLYTIRNFTKVFRLKIMHVYLIFISRKSIEFRQIYAKSTSARRRSMV